MRHNFIIRLIGVQIASISPCHKKSANVCLTNTDKGCRVELKVRGGKS